MSQLITTTARDLIRRAMILIGSLGVGENPNDQEAEDALMTLNEIIDKWNIESLMITSTESYNVPLVGKKIYTIGPGGDINVHRPPNGITQAYYNMPTSNLPVSLPIEIISQNQYNEIVLKDLQVTIPNVLYYNADYPLGHVFIHPISSVGNVSLITNNSFDAFESLDAIVDLPPGYLKALRYNLAVELSTEYGRQLDQRIEEMAIGAKAFIKANNSTIKKDVLMCDSALRKHYGRGNFNIYTGGY